MDKNSKWCFLLRYKMYFLLRNCTKYWTPVSSKKSLQNSSHQKFLANNRNVLVFTAQHHCFHILAQACNRIAYKHLKRNVITTISGRRQELSTHSNSHFPALITTVILISENVTYDSYWVKWKSHYSHRILHNDVVFHYQKINK